MPAAVFFTPEERKRALELTSAGTSVQDISRLMGFSLAEFQTRRRKDYDVPALLKLWQHAQMEGIECLADTLITADKDKNPFQARIYSENIKWLLARRNAARYGDRLDITQGITTVDIARALEDARARAMVAHTPPAPLQLVGANVGADSVDSSELVTVESTGHLEGESAEVGQGFHKLLE